MGSGAGEKEEEERERGEERLMRNLDERSSQKKREEKEMPDRSEGDSNQTLLFFSFTPSTLPDFSRGKAEEERPLSPLLDRLSATGMFLSLLLYCYFYSCLTLWWFICFHPNFLLLPPPHRLSPLWCKVQKLALLLNSSKTPIPPAYLKGTCCKLCYVT